MVTTRMLDANIWQMQGWIQGVRTPLFSSVVLVWEFENSLVLVSIIVPKTFSFNYQIEIDIKQVVLVLVLVN